MDSGLGSASSSDTKGRGALAEALEEGNVRAAVEVLKAVGVHGKVEAPSGEADPELVVVRQAEVWARKELAKEDPTGDVLARFREDERLAELTQERLQELRAGAV